MSSPEDPPKKDPLKVGSVDELYASDNDAWEPAPSATPVPEAPPVNESTPEAPADDRDIGSVDELYGSAPNPFPTHEPTVVASDEVAPPAPAPADPPPPAPATRDDTPILPVASEAVSLQEAIGAAQQKRRITARFDSVPQQGPTRLSRRMMTVLAFSGLAIIAIAVLVILGSVNSRRYAITCSTDRVHAEQGRSFPPWGTQPMDGAEWKAIVLPPNGECTARETETKSELEGWYLDILVERASETLTKPNLIEGVPPPPATGKAPPTILDNVSDQLQQALLLSRSADRRDQRKEVERMLGDVQYWRASLRLRDASAALLDASKQFEVAAQQRPRHVTDAAAWSQYVKKLADDLRAGPNGVPPTSAAQSFPPAPGNAERPSAPMGTALPVETPSPQTDSAAEETPPPTPDAGVPTGGVLL